MAGKTIGEFVSLGIILIIVGLSLVRFDLGPELGPLSTGEQGKVEVVSWNWKQSRNGQILAVFGNVENKTRTNFEEVVLELRVEDKIGLVLARHTIHVGKLGAEEKRPFREDILRSGKEEMGYLEVKSLRK
jgi:hypothetical protein